jgi:hypothetical protein
MFAEDVCDFSKPCHHWSSLVTKDRDYRFNCVSGSLRIDSGFMPISTRGLVGEFCYCAAQAPEC